MSVWGRSTPWTSRVSGSAANSLAGWRAGQCTALTAANRDFRLTKATGWDSVALERVEESTKEGRGAEVGAVVCGEGELIGTGGYCADARYCRDLSPERAHDRGATTDRHECTAKAQGRDVGPRQGQLHVVLPSWAKAQAMENFFSSVYQAILRLIPFQSLKAIVIASPGFTKESVSSSR